MRSNNQDMIEYMLIEAYHESKSLMAIFHEELKSHNEYLDALKITRTTLKKLLIGYRSETLDIDIILATLDGCLHKIERIRKALEDLKSSKKRIPRWLTSLIILLEKIWQYLSMHVH